MLTFDSMASEKPIRYVRPHQPLSEWLSQLYARRETLWFFVWKDFKVQYNNPFFGIIWSVFQPLVYFGIILAVMNVSGRNMNNSEMPFPVYLICGLAVWNFATSAILSAINSMQANSGIISKSFFPRFYLILAPILRSTIDLIIVLAICFGIALFYGQSIRLEAITFIPNLLVLLWLTTLGWASIAAAATVWNRHLRHVIPIVLYAMIFVLPVFYSVHSLNNPSLDLIYSMNPIAGSMDYLRACFSPTAPNSSQLIMWLILSLIWVIIGIVVMRKTEKSIADKV